MPRTKLPKADWVVVGPFPYLASCTRCGKGEPQPPPMSLKKFLAELTAIRARHAGCQEAGDGEDEAAVRRSQPAPAEDADAEAERASPAASDGAVAAAGGLAR